MKHRNENIMRSIILFSANIDAPDITPMHITIAADVVEKGRFNWGNIYYCDISNFDETRFLQIEWALSPGWNDYITLHKSDFITYENRSIFRQATALAEEHLLASGVEQINYRVSMMTSNVLNY